MKIKTWIVKTLAALSIGSALAKPAPIVDQPWLKDYLTYDTTIYIRIPHPLFYFAEADTPLADLYRNDNYIASIKAITKAISKQIQTSDDDKELKQLLDMLLEYANAPIEIALPEKFDLANLKPGTPPTVVIATKFNYQNTDLLISKLQTVFVGSPVTLTHKKGADSGKITIPPAQLDGHYRYNKNSGRFVIAFGEKANDYADKVDALIPNILGTISDYEKSIDTSGQGLFISFKPSPMMFMMLPRTKPLKKFLEVTQLNQAKEIAIGMGIAQKRPKIKFIAAMPKVGLRKLLPIYPRLDDVNYYGLLQKSVNFNLPNSQIIDTIIAAIDDPKTTQKYREFKSEFLQTTKVNVDDLIKLVSRKFVYFKDDLGNFVATDKQFSQDLMKIVASLQKKSTCFTSKQIKSCRREYLSSRSTIAISRSIQKRK